MTPEERFTKIENAIENLIETQARHDAVIEKQNAGIRDLIRLSGIFLESQKQVVGNIGQLAQNIERLAEAQAEAQRHTDASLNRLGEKVDQLSDAVDRFLKGLQKPNGNQ